HTEDLSPDVLDLLGERKRPAATAQAVLYLPAIDLCESEQRPAQGFCRAMRQGLGGRCAKQKVWKRQLWRSGRLGVKSHIQRQGRFLTVDGLLKGSSEKMDRSKGGETSGFQFPVLYTSCQGERMLSMHQSTRWVIPRDGCDLGPVPRRFRQRSLIGTGLGHLPGLLKPRLHLGPVLRLLHRQDRQAVEGQTD